MVPLEQAWWSPEQLHAPHRNILTRVKATSLPGVWQHGSAANMLACMPGTTSSRQCQVHACLFESWQSCLIGALQNALSVAALIFSQPALPLPPHKSIPALCNGFQLPGPLQFSSGMPLLLNHPCDPSLLSLPCHTGMRRFDFGEASIFRVVPNPSATPAHKAVHTGA